MLVTVKNPGNRRETNVPVKVTWTGPGGAASQTLTATIAEPAEGATRTVAGARACSIPTTAITKSSTLKVMAGPVPGEKVLSNNHATYTIVPVLK